MTTRLGLMGDIHGDKGWAKNRLTDFVDAGIDRIIQLGDFGVWPGNWGTKVLYRINKALQENNQHMMVVLGNHEDYVRVSSFQPINDGGEFDGFVYDPKYPNIKFFRRGHKITIEGVTFLAVGGANSIDRNTRTPNIDWWEGEQISTGDIYRSIEAAQGGVDVMLCHDVPLEVPIFGTHRDADAGWQPTQVVYARGSREALSSIVPVAKPRMLFHGHYHRYIDLTVPMKDWTGKPYVMRSIGMDMNGNANNIGVLELPSLNFEVLKYPVPYKG